MKKITNILIVIGMALVGGGIGVFGGVYIVSAVFKSVYKNVDGFGWLGVGLRTLVISLGIGGLVAIITGIFFVWRLKKGTISKMRYRILLTMQVQCREAVMHSQYIPI